LTKVALFLHMCNICSTFAANLEKMDHFTLPGRICSTTQIREIANKTQSEWTLIQLKPEIKWVYLGLERMLQIGNDTGAVMVYSDHFNPNPAPVIDYQAGALRDDFDFGSVLLIRTSSLHQVTAEMQNDFQYAGLYDLRLRLSRIGELVHIPEFLYYDIETDLRKSGEKLFDYVDPKNRMVQIEMEACVTEHLRALNAMIDYKKLLSIPHNEDSSFAVTASVIIPCRNRVRTIGDAIRSALAQEVKQPYSYNVIVVDDNSTDGTIDVIKELEQTSNRRLIYIPQDPTWHAIGGNWNVALHCPKCGKYAIQLDSDDTYYDEHTVQKFIDTFEQQECAMVVGTYRMTDIDGHELPPGIIDHREWTPENGMNNALRINGLGAPRGFYTPLLREINFPTTKYGEDYAVGLRICREYKLGRIYDVVYNCRRWEDNSDANCDVVAMNRNNWYKDRIRTWELKARIKQNN